MDFRTIRVQLSVHSPDEHVLLHMILASLQFIERLLRQQPSNSHHVRLRNLCIPYDYDIERKFHEHSSAVLPNIPSSPRPSRLTSTTTVRAVLHYVPRIFLLNILSCFRFITIFFMYSKVCTTLITQLCLARHRHAQYSQFRRRIFHYVPL